MVIMGPGLSLNEETQQLVRELAREIEKPLLIDGDGITAIARDTDILRFPESTDCADTPPRRNGAAYR